MVAVREGTGRMNHIFYHGADLDGICSAAIALHTTAIGRSPCNLHACDYGKPFPWYNISQGDHGIMLDFSLSPADMYRLDRALSSFVWIDHHKSAIESVRRYMEETPHSGYPLKGLREIGRAGCELTWDYFQADTPVPYVVRMLGRYDVFDHRDPDIRPFQYGCRLDSADPSDAIWKRRLSAESTDELSVRILGNGRIIESWERRENARKLAGRGFATVLGGMKVLACNETGGSLLFEDIPSHLSGDYAAYLTFVYSSDRKQWVYGLYGVPGKDIDLSEFAARYGGGGHARAAGFHHEHEIATEGRIH